MGEAHRVVPDELDPLAIVGTTASGKSALAMALARHRGDVELVSVDSMQVYRGMDIGTAKPTPAEQAAPTSKPASVLVCSNRAQWRCCA